MCRTGNNRLTGSVVHAARKARSFVLPIRAFDGRMFMAYQSVYRFLRYGRLAGVA